MKNPNIPVLNGGWLICGAVLIVLCYCESKAGLRSAGMKRQTETDGEEQEQKDV